jgi:hypothetical protein
VAKTIYTHVSKCKNDKIKFKKKEIHIYQKKKVIRNFDQRILCSCMEQSKWNLFVQLICTNNK